MKKFFYLSLTVAVLFFFAGMDQLFTNSAQGPAGYTGAPGESSCSDCHTGSGGLANAFMKVGNNITSYVPGMEYNMEITINELNATLFGFVFTVIDELDNKAGDLAIIGPQSDPVKGQMLVLDHTNGREYLTHNPASSQNHKKFKWTAPNGGTLVKFFLAANAANNNGDTDGDIIVLASFALFNSVGMDEAALFTAKAYFESEDYLKVSYPAVSNESTILRIYNLHGQLLMQKALKDAVGLAEHRIDCSQLPASVYLVQLEHKESNWVRKIVKK